jgi:hypothetical protein
MIKIFTLTWILIIIFDTPPLAAGLNQKLKLGPGLALGFMPLIALMCWRERFPFQIVFFQ